MVCAPAILMPAWAAWWYGGAPAATSAADVSWVCNGGSELPKEWMDQRMGTGGRLTGGLVLLFRFSFLYGNFLKNLIDSHDEKTQSWKNWAILAGWSSPKERTIYDQHSTIKSIYNLRSFCPLIKVPCLWKSTGLGPIWRSWKVESEDKSHRFRHSSEHMPKIIG